MMQIIEYLEHREEPPEDNRYHTREEMEKAMARADAILDSELPFNENGELNNA